MPQKDLDINMREAEKNEPEKGQRDNEVYVAENGDTLYSITGKYNSTLDAIFTANPYINPLNINAGQEIIVPLNTSVVKTNMHYTYEIMERDIQKLKIRYPMLEYGTAGKSILGRNLYYIKLGTGPHEVFYNGAHHGNEWITSLILMKFTEDYLKAYSSKSRLKSYSIPEIWNKHTIFIMPMVNPDGVELVIKGIDSSNPYYKEVMGWNKGSSDFKRWSANIRGVDINHNYDADFITSKKRESIYRAAQPSKRRFSGPSPESEPETKAVVEFTRSHSFRLALAYHSQGEAIYYNYKNLQPARAQTIGHMFSKVSGYRLVSPNEAVSYSGYKDWFIKEYRNPGYTIEVGKGSNPLPIDQFDKIYNDNLELFLLASFI